MTIRVRVFPSDNFLAAVDSAASFETKDTALIECNWHLIRLQLGRERLEIRGQFLDFFNNGVLTNGEAAQL